MMCYLSPGPSWSAIKLPAMHELVRKELSHRVICEFIPIFADYEVKCFITEPLALSGAAEIIESWRVY